MAQLKQQNIQVPDKDPVSVTEAARALGINSEAVHRLILEGKLGALNIGRAFSNVESYRIPLKNFVTYINGVHRHELDFIFPAADPLTVPRIAKALSCSDQHVYNLINAGEFQNAMDISVPGSSISKWRIPLSDLVAFVNRRREGAY